MKDITEQENCVCGHVADEHDGECQVEGCHCAAFELDENENDEKPAVVPPRGRQGRR